MSLYSSKKLKKTLLTISTLLFLNQNLLCEDIIKQEKCSTLISKKCEYNLGEKGTLTISNQFINYTSNLFIRYDLPQYYSIVTNFVEGNEFVSHKIFNVKIKDNNHVGIFLLFNSGTFGFYLFDKDMNDMAFFEIEKIDKVNGKTNINVNQVKNTLHIDLKIGKNEKKYSLKTSNIISKKINLNQ